jgi:hypothetical protein
LTSRVCAEQQLAVLELLDFTRQAVAIGDENHVRLVTWPTCTAEHHGHEGRDKTDSAG